MKRNSWLAAVVLGLALSQTVQAESSFVFDKTPGQLPKTVIPLAYTITITPDLKTFSTQGRETIEIEVKTPTATLVVNTLDMTVSTAQLEDDQPAQIRTDNKQQTTTLTFAQPIPVGVHRLQLAFQGKIGPQPQGLFYDKYDDGQGQKVLLGTQMEATDARRMFPNWDEPVYRSTFQLTVNVPENFMAVSNTPITAEKPLGQGLKQVSFERTPKMASYLVVLVAGELEALEDEAAGVKLRVVTTKGKKEKGRYALESLKKILPYYNDYFGVKYPLPKLDMIALPGGFPGAMENWGGITYNERRLLFDPKNSSLFTKQGVFQVIAHEVAHQWFGDLVTMAWWDNLWLNEGFASWMGTKASDHFNPDWQLWLRANQSKETAMASDARRTTHPIQQPINNPAEAASAFDEITYRKGQAVIRMLEGYLGEDPFREGIRHYMAAHAYSNTTTADLWTALQATSGKPVQAVAATWTEQPGFPVVKVAANCLNQTQQVQLQQERFTLRDPNAKAQLWQIPLALAQTQGEPTQTLMTTPTAVLEAGTCQGGILLNAGNTGYYRVQYEPTLFKKLGQDIQQLPVANRVSLLSDTWALVESGRVRANNYLSLVKSLGNDTNLAVWEQVVDSLETLDTLREGKPSQAGLRAFGRSVLHPLLTRLGWEAKSGEEPTTSILRADALALLGTFGDKAVIAESRKRFQKFLKNPSSLDPNLRPSVLEVVGRYSDQKTYDTLRALGRKALTTEEKQLYYGALAMARDPKLARQTLALTLTDELTSSLAPSYVTQVAQSGHPQLAWDFAKANMAQLEGKLADFNRFRFVPTLMTAFTDAKRAEELEAYAKTHLPPEAQREVAKGAERIRSRAELKTREGNNIDTWLCNESPQVVGSKVQLCVTGGQ
ncbi:M1 family metallopeptidase [Anthocerotibacter panamensis]|uniref:M1 family metallopeptidase n=1 Tax=Anthocerotibacter panamensis TaxID=2857077 RepID=UPI001C40761C|nr:M1 family metallopeptidase [Anthocerotibacter panamensis]